MTTMFRRLLQARPEPEMAPAPAPDDVALVERLSAAGAAIEKLLGETGLGLEPHLYSPTVPLHRLTGPTAVTLVGDETVLREALRRLRAIRAAVIAEAEDRGRLSLARIA